MSPPSWWISVSALSGVLEEVYELASDLAPALVVLDETDLVSLGCATQRGRSGPRHRPLSVNAAAR